MNAPSYFFIIGAMKAGTTSLYNYLADHPDLYASPKKEPRVFREARDLDLIRAEFLKLFEGRTSERWCFEGSTAYTKFPRFAGIPGRIAAIAPESRFIYLVRNPVDRTWSQYLHNLANGRESRPLLRAVREDAQYLETSRYAQQLQQYLRVFPRERILIQVFEDLVADPKARVREACRFLEVDATFEPSTSAVAFNASSEKVAAPSPIRAARALGIHDCVPWRIRRWLKDKGNPLPQKKSVMPPEVRAELAAALAGDIDQFFDLLGHRIAAWTDFRGAASPVSR